MNDFFRGIGIVVFITLLAGAIAYVGDRVGHQVGRKRLTLFGIRPRYTSTIIAVGTGMVIALFVTVGAILASQNVKTAFFRVGELNTEVNQLQAQADVLDKTKTLGNVVVRRGDLIWPQFLVIKKGTPPEDRLKLLSQFFDATARAANATYVPRGLKPVKKRANDPSIADQLKPFAYVKLQAMIPESAAVIVASADVNLFQNDPIHYQFLIYADVLVFAANQPIVSTTVPAGAQSASDLRAILSQLGQLAGNAAFERHMPPFFSESPAYNLTQAQFEEMVTRLRAGNGKYTITAVAATDVRPSNGGIVLDFTLVKAK